MKRLIALAAFGAALAYGPVAAETAPPVAVELGCVLGVHYLPLGRPTMRDETQRAEPDFESIAAGISPGTYELDENHGYLSFSYSHLGLSNPELQFQ